MTDHTPGPWRAVESYVFFGETSETSNGRQLADCRGREGALFDATSTDIETRFANARLIAAAPDLLAVLEEALPDIAFAAHAAGCYRVLDAAKAAIAKAKGETL